MKKKWICGSWRFPESLKRVLMLMKIIVFILMVSFSTISANTMAQTKLSIKLNDVKISQVLREISQKTDYEFLYNNKEINSLGKVSVNVVDAKIIKILDICFKDKGVDYKIQDKVILISPKKIEIVQADKKTVKGKVVDEKGNALPGVTVQVQGTNLGVATDGKGRYEIKAKPSDALRFSFIGYKTQLVMINNKEKVDVKLFPETESLEEVQVVAFGTQKKESVVSSITSIKPEALKSSSSDLTSSFVGNVAGLVGWQTGGAPGALTEEEMNTKFYIRGITSFQSKANIDPLILLDGVEISKLDLSRISPDDIESFNVLKDASATAMYGARGANGVISVTTKKGKEGSVYTTFRAEKVWSMPTKEIDVVDPVTYMKMYNEAFVGRNPGMSPLYTVEKINRTASGKYPNYAYPAVDWYDELFKKYSVNDHYNLNVRGGTKRLQYYVSVNYNSDEGMIKTDRLNQFDCNITNKQTTFRTNLNVELTETAKMTLNSFSTYDVYNGTIADVRKAYDLVFNSSPVSFPAVFPDDVDDRYQWPHIKFGGSSFSKNPYLEVHRGYKDRKRYSSINKLEYIQNLNKLCKGLEARLSVSMNKNGYYQTVYNTIPARYTASNYDDKTGKISLTPLNLNSSRVLGIDLEKSKTDAKTSMEYRFTAIHSAAWGNHQTSLTAVASRSEISDNRPDIYQNSLPHRNLGYSARASYGYKDKYFIEASAGYNGSERFSKENKMGFFPAFGGAWIASKEDFMRSIDSWLSYLKFRFSYGKVGNDGVISNPRFVYIEDIVEIPASAGQKFGRIASPEPYYNILSYENPNTSWEIAEQINLGTELKLFKGLIDMNIDIYQEIRHNIYSYRNTLPSSIGLYSKPLDNIGKVRSRGFDFSGKIQHAFSNDFWFIFNTTLTYNQAKYLKIEEVANKPAWQRKIGREISQAFGYVAEGLFHDYDEIYSSPKQDGDVQPGDIKYKDIDGDGRIDENDVVPIGHPETPRLITGFNGFIHYKNFEFNFAFQGAGNRSFFIDPSSVSPLVGNTAVLSAIANDHWTVDNQKEHPFWPRLSTKNIIDHNPQEDYYNANAKEIRKSTYFMKSGKFLRCKNLQLSYYINEKLLDKVNIKNMKLYVRADNPFIISDFDVWDIELGENGFNYPIQRTYSVGVNISF